MPWFSPRCWDSHFATPTSGGRSGTQQSKAPALPQDSTSTTSGTPRASLVIAQGAHPKAAQVHLGHSPISVTMDRYGHLFSSDMQALAVGSRWHARSSSRGPHADQERIRGPGVDCPTGENSPVRHRGFSWSWRRESNPRPADYKSAALPTELRQRGYSGFAATAAMSHELRVNHTGQERLALNRKPLTIASRSRRSWLKAFCVLGPPRRLPGPRPLRHSSSPSRPPSECGLGRRPDLQSVSPDPGPRPRPQWRSAR